MVTVTSRPRSSFLVAVVFVLALFAAAEAQSCSVVDDCKPYCGSRSPFACLVDSCDCERRERERQLVGKSLKATKGTKAPKSPKSSKGSQGCNGAGRCSCDCGHRRYLTADHETATRYLTGLEKKEEIEQLMTRGPNPVDFSGTFREKADILSVEECKLLVEYLDAGGSAPPQEDDSDSFSIRDRILSAQELIDILGKQRVTDLLRFLYESVDDKFDAIVRKIWLRRVDNDGTLANYVDMHTDQNHAKYKQSTMVVALNSENHIEGGELFYLNQDGPVEAQRVQGKAHAHKYDVLHGVAPHKGSRISLLIHLDHDPAPGVEDLLNDTDLKPL